MKKNNSYTVLSTKRCACGCGKFLKQNLVDKNPEAEFIFKHYPLSKKNRATANPKHNEQSNLSAGLFMAEHVPAEVANANI